MKHFLRTKKNFCNLVFVILFCLSEQSYAFNVATGNIRAEVLPGTISTKNIDADLIYDDLPITNIKGNIDSFPVSSKDAGNGLSFKEKMVYLTYRPNTLVDIAYGHNALSEQDNKTNEKGYATVVLRNNDYKEMTAKIKIGQTKIYFDKDGNAQIKVLSIYYIGKNQPKGTYRGYYHMVISY